MSVPNEQLKIPSCREAGEVFHYSWSGEGALDPNKNVVVRKEFVRKEVRTGKLVLFKTGDVVTVDREGHGLRCAHLVGLSEGDTKLGSSPDIRCTLRWFVNKEDIS